ncbi:MAG: hypothetical protein M5U34_31795 [Chloroflexi bacterium]|nr:hypothetical protein [Chloroflexota bacterium]
MPFPPLPTALFSLPYLRAQQTAVPTQEKYPHVPCETWPVEEFTYLHPRHYQATTGADRWPAAKAYWDKNDPEFKEAGEGESFAELMVGCKRSKPGWPLIRLNSSSYLVMVCFYALFA